MPDTRHARRRIDDEAAEDTVSAVAPRTEAEADRAIDEVRARELAVDAAARAAQEEWERVRTDLLAGYRDLARVRLDALAAEQVGGELDRAEHAALAALRGFREALAVVAERRAAAAASVEHALRGHQACTKRVEEAAASLATFVTETATRCRSTAEWEALHAQAEEATRVAEAAEAKAAQAEADLDAKRTPYEADPLFTYLWSGGFGTPAYAAGWPVRRIDRWVARLVGFDGARTNYALLNEIPRRLREHAAQRRRQLAELEQRLEAFERRALEEAGITPLEAEVAGARAALDDATRAHAAARAAHAALDREHAALAADGRAPGKPRAADVLFEAVSGEPIQALHRHAVATPSPDDDAIVRRIDEAKRAARSLEMHLEALREDTRALSVRRQALEAERERIRRALDAEIAERVIEGLFRGVLGGRRSGGFGGWGGRRGGGGGGGARGGFGGGGFTTGGRSGGGGFRTGGSF